MSELAWGDKPAGFWIRFCASVVDGVILSVMSGVAGGIVGFTLGMAGLESISGIVGMVIGLAASATYYTLLTAKGGQTWGKMAFNIKVVSAQGGPVSMGTALFRWIGYYINVLTLAIGYIMAGLNKEKKGLHDMIAGTKVVRLAPIPTLGVVLACLVGAGVVLVPVMGGIVAAVAIPKYAQMLEKSKEGATKGNISAIKSAISIYYGDHNAWPKAIDQAPFVGEYMSELPAEKVTGSNQVHRKFNGQGGWVYHSKSGKVYLNLEGTDTRGNKYARYGYE